MADDIAVAGGRHRLAHPPRAAWDRAGLRARVTVTFALGALALSALMAGLTYLTARQVILHQREAAIVRQAYGNAFLVRSTLPTTSPADIPQLLSSLDTVGSRSVLHVDGSWFVPAGEFNFGEDAIPAALRNLVLDGTPADQHLQLNGTTQLMVGVPVPSAGAAYFEVFSLDDTARTLKVLALALSGAALVTTVLGAVIGRWASGRLLRPLADVSQAAETIAAGRLDTRLTATDDADLAPLADSFNRMADALQERIQREARFTSDVSHELRSPLTTLSTSLGVLEAHADDLAPRSRQALDLLAAELRRFQRMVADLLEISRVDTGSADLALDEVEVGELLRQSARTGSARGVPIVVDATVDHQRLWVDKRRIEQVLSNLLTNAQQYAGGATRLAAEPAGDAVRLVVADRGPGVAPPERARVFERFYRGQAAGQRGAADGTGLGLALVAEHIRMHGGRVWVEAGGDGETRFVVELPTHPPGAPPPGDGR